MFGCVICVYKYNKFPNCSPRWPPLLSLLVSRFWEIQWNAMFLEYEFPDDYYAECLDIHVLLYVLHYHFYLSVKLFFNCHPLPISSKCYWSDITAIVSPQLEIRPHGFSSSSCPGGFFSLLSNSYFCVILTSPNIACSMLPRLSLISSSRFFF